MEINQCLLFVDSRFLFGFVSAIDRFIANISVIFPRKTEKML